MVVPSRATFAIEVNNPGKEPVEAVAMSASLSEHVALSFTSTPTGGSRFDEATRTTVFRQIRRIEPGGATSFEIHVRANAAGEATCRVSLQRSGASGELTLPGAVR